MPQRSALGAGDEAGGTWSGAGSGASSASAAASGTAAPAGTGTGAATGTSSGAPPARGERRMGTGRPRIDPHLPAPPSPAPPSPAQPCPAPAPCPPWRAAHAHVVNRPDLHKSVGQSGGSEINVTPPGDDPGVTTQLRLLDPPETTPAPRRARTTARVTKQGQITKQGRVTATKSGRASGAGKVATARRAAHWAGELHLDARTRKVGRTGVAAAREALERVAAEQERARSEREGRSQRASSARRLSAPTERARASTSPGCAARRTLCPMGDQQRPTPSAWQELATKELKGDPSSLTWVHARGHHGQAAVHRRGPRRAALRRHAARLRALRARPAGHDVRGAALDHPPVRRLLHRRGVERLLPAQRWPPAARASRWPSTWPPTAATTRDHPRVDGRRRQGRRGHRLGRGHEDPLRRHPARQDVACR